MVDDEDKLKILSNLKGWGRYRIKFTKTADDEDKRSEKVVV